MDDGTGLVDAIVFIRRQSPDWSALARDFRAGRPIDPARYVPDHPIPGFPANIIALVAAWNVRFAIDFFSARAIIADLSRANIRSVDGSISRGLGDLAEIAELARSQRLLAFFHDDDDFFAPDMFARLHGTDACAFDTSVFPLHRVGAETFTFARADMAPEIILGHRRAFDFRFQSNNYGITVMPGGAAHLLALKDHVLGSAFADAAGLTERILSFAVSATVKTPASASQLPALLGEHATMSGQFAGFIAQARRPVWPPGHRWLSVPLTAISQLLESVAANDGPADLATS